jgi:hypothetical protein
VPLGLVVPISGGAAGVVVATRARRRAQRSQCPDWADGGQAPVLDMAVQHNGFLPAGEGDRGGSGERFESSGVSEAAAVVADLGQHPGTGELSQAREDISCYEESSSQRRCRRERAPFVVALTGLETVVQLAEELMNRCRCAWA